jgi:hypothetical protein
MYKPGKRDSHNYKKPIIHCLFLSSDSQAQDVRANLRVP